MDLLVFEYVTGGGLRGEILPTGLAIEGELMLRALLTDLLENPGVKPVVLRDDRLGSASLPSGVTAIPIMAGDDLDRIWTEAIDRCDAAWPIAPESNGVLERLCRDVERTATALLNSPADAVAIAASKLGTARRLERHRLPVVPTYPFEERTALGAVPAVTKPDDGAGCEGARVVDNAAEFRTGSGRWIAQPLLEGDALSLSALFAQGRARLLSCNRQHVERAGDGFKLLGCTVNALEDTDGYWQALASSVAAALPELWGYAGIDLIMTAQGPRILEINPRLTTSYAGLKKATGENPAAMVLELHATGRLPPPRTCSGKAIALELDMPHAH
ncbi:MAG: ATP-grasp domain-containing protein [Methylococcus sp.]|nr:ATP-grasp domain-containing protein [Methylococcus sp.]